jgi:transcriptional regulator with XRE-family HTH domain
LVTKFFKVVFYNLDSEIWLYQVVFYNLKFRNNYIYWLTHGCEIQPTFFKKDNMNEEIIVSHAKKLRFLRKKSDKTQQDLANHLGLSQQAYSKLENGETSFSDETIDKLANFFGITPAEFESSSESVIVGSNNSNNSNTSAGYNIYNLDPALVDTMKKLHEQNLLLIERNKEIFSDLIKEKDKRIQLLEQLLQNTSK